MQTKAIIKAIHLLCFILFTPFLFRTFRPLRSLYQGDYGRVSENVRQSLRKAHEMPFLKGILCHRLSADDVQVAVAHTQFVKKSFRLAGVPQHDLIAQFVERSHVRRLDALQLRAAGIGLEQIVEEAVVIQVLRDRDFEFPFVRSARAETDRGQQ